MQAIGKREAMLLSWLQPVSYRLLPRKRLASRGLGAIVSKLVNMTPYRWVRAVMRVDAEPTAVVGFVRQMRRAFAQAGIASFAPRAKLSAIYRCLRYDERRADRWRRCRTRAE